MQIFLNVPASKFALPPDRSYRCDTAQGSRGFYVRAYRALLPPHAPDMLTVRKQVIDGTGTFTLSDSQPCRLLTLLHRLSPASTLLRRDPTSAWPSAGRRCLLPAYRSHPIAHARWGALRGPMQTSQGKDTGCTAAPGPNTAPISVGFWASRSLARSPDRPGLRRASLTFGAAARLRLLPHTTSRRQAGLSRDAPPACSCLRLAVASNLLRRGLAPPIQGPCLAHQGCSLRSHRLRRLKPLTLTLSPAVHSAMSSMLHCCTSDLKRRRHFGRIAST